MTANQVSALRAQEEKRANLESERLRQEENYLARQKNIIAERDRDIQAKELERKTKRDAWERSLGLQSELRQQSQGNRKLDIETARAVTGGIADVGKGLQSGIGAIGALAALFA